MTLLILEPLFTHNTYYMNGRRVRHIRITLTHEVAVTWVLRRTPTGIGLELKAAYLTTTQEVSLHSHFQDRSIFKQ